MAKPNTTTSPDFDVIVVGAGAGGICASLAAARSGARTLLVERAPQVGGTGVHSPVSLICKFHGTDHRPINLGIHRELFPEAYLHSTRDKRPSAPRLTYDERVLFERYQRLLNAEPNLVVRTSTEMTAVSVHQRRIQSITLADGAQIFAPIFVDSTANAVLSRLAGMDTMKGRQQDGAMQSATLTFALENIDTSHLRDPDFTTRGGLDSLLEELTRLYRQAKQEGRTTNPRVTVQAFPYPDGKRLLFNSNEVLGVDPTRSGSIKEATTAAQRMVEELIAVVRQHPAFTQSQVSFVSSQLGVREGPRVVGDYVLTQEDCLGEARFEDMVAACAYEIDIHDPDGAEAHMVDIPGSGYYHIPYRCLIARDAENLLLASRCVSATHEAHSSLRVMSGITAIGQAAGTAAALAARLSPASVRGVMASWIRHTLREQVQFVEGTTEKAPRFLKNGAANGDRTRDP